MIKKRQKWERKKKGKGNQQTKRMYVGCDLRKKEKIRSKRKRNERKIIWNGHQRKGENTGKENEKNKDYVVCDFKGRREKTRKEKK